MSRTPSSDQTRWAELTISYVLRAGVLLSLVAIAAGVVLTFAQHPSYLHSAPAYRHLTSHRAPIPHTIGGVIDGVSRFRGEAVAAFGLLILLATPVLRVAISIVLFLTQRDATYTAITSAVLAVLVASFVLGKAGQ
jgi:uncharacterized membrane protein